MKPINFRLPSSFWVLLFLTLIHANSALSEYSKSGSMLEVFSNLNPVLGNFESYMNEKYGKDKWDKGHDLHIRTVGLTDSQISTLRFFMTENDIVRYRRDVESIRRKLYKDPSLEFYVKKVDVLVEAGEGMFDDDILDNFYIYEAKYISFLVYKLASFDFKKIDYPDFTLRYTRHDFFRLTAVLHIHDYQTDELHSVVLLDPSNILRTYLCGECQWEMPPIKHLPNKSLKFGTPQSGAP